MVAIVLVETMTVDLVFITYNRLYYTKLALASILADPKEEFSLTIWDNASTDGSVKYLKHNVSDPRIVDIVLSKENVGQTAVLNKVWANSKADLLGKLDNDCILTAGWTRTLAQAHDDIDNLGVVACWPFFLNDFDYERARHKIHRLGKHQIFRHPWTCGTGFLIKRETLRKFGHIQNKSITQYWLDIAAAGYINGFYFPLIYQEHMDDPKSSYCKIKDEENYSKAAKVTSGIQAGRYNNLAGRLRWREEIVRNLLEDPYDPRYYIGWRRKLRSVKSCIHDFFTPKSSTEVFDGSDD